MPTTQIRPAQVIRYVDPERSGTYDNPGSSFDVAFGDTAALLPAILVSNVHMDTALVNDVGRTAAIVSNMTTNDKQHAILEHVRLGGAIDYTAIFDLELVGTV